MSRKTWKTLQKIMVMAIDIIIINLSIYIAFLITFILIKGNDGIPAENLAAYGQLAIPITILSIIAMDWVGLYKYYRKSWREILTSVFYMAVFEVIMIAVLSYFTATYKYPRWVMVLSPVILTVFLFTWKMIVLRLYRKNRDTARIIVVGDKEETDKVIQKMTVHCKWKQDIAYVFTPEETGRIMKRLDGVDEIVICPSVSEKTKDILLNLCTQKGKWIYVVPSVEEILLTHSRIVQFDDLPAMMIEQLELTWEQRFVKRAFDIIVSFIGIILSSPIMLACAIAVKVSSPGPVLYAQERLTRDSKPYKMYKFRSMRTDAEAAGPAFSSKDDPRVTKVGRVLRKYRLDELPQLFNIFIGEMSVVGPRAERPYFVEKFEKETPQFRYRTNVKAGLTGLAQIRGNYDTHSEDKLRYDLMYIRNYSVLYDLVLVFRTIGVIVTGHTHGS